MSLSAISFCCKGIRYVNIITTFSLHHDAVSLSYQHVISKRMLLCCSLIMSIVVRVWLIRLNLDLGSYPHYSRTLLLLLQRRRSVVISSLSFFYHYLLPTLFLFDSQSHTASTNALSLIKPVTLLFTYCQCPHSHHSSITLPSPSRLLF